MDLSENRKLTYYKDIRIISDICDPKNKENIICEKNETKRAEFLSNIAF
jgi:hypothetical protein